MASSVVAYSIIARPSCSLSPKGWIGVVALIASFSLAVAIGFSLVYAWQVLPFAGLVLVAMAYAFYYINCHAADYASITIEGDQPVVAKQDYKNIRPARLCSTVIGRTYFRQLPSGDQSL